MPTPTAPPPSRALERDLASLRRRGILPPMSAAVAVPTKAFQSPPATGPVVAHLDPGQLRFGNELATIYAYGPSTVDTKVGDMSLGTSAGYPEPVLFLELWDQTPGTDVVVSISAYFGGGDDTVVISATGNVPVTIHVPMTAGTNGYCAAVLEPQPPHGGFAWWSADFRHI
jgi:hypothetical protein